MMAVQLLSGGLGILAGAIVVWASRKHQWPELGVVGGVVAGLGLAIIVLALPR